MSSATLRVQHRFDFDLVKISPPGTYQAMDLGAVDAWCGGRRGYGMIVHHPLQTPSDWEKLAGSARTGPAVARAMAAIPQVRAGLSQPRPILQTVFSPVALAEQLAGQLALRHMLHTWPKIAHAALNRLAVCVEGTIAAALAAGATGVFYAIQQMRHGFFSKEEYDDLYRAYDAPCVQRLAESTLSLVHIHGLDIHLPPLPLPRNCWLHWETLAPNPTVRQVLARFDAPLALGLPGGLLTGLAERDGIDAWLDGLLRQLDGRPAMLTPGCTLPLDMPHAVVDRWLAVRRRRSAAPLPAARPGLPVAAATAPAKAAAELVTEACADLMRPGQHEVPGAAIRLLLRLEQDLQRPLPVEPFRTAPLDAASLLRTIAQTPPPTPAGSSGRTQPTLHILMEPGVPPDRLMGLCRVLRDVANVRLVELEAALWVARRAEARSRLIRAIAQQLGDGDEPLRLLGYGRGADILAWFIETAGGTRPIAFFGQILPAPGASPAPGRKAKAIRRTWIRWATLAAAWDRPGLVTVPAAMAARFFGHRPGKILSNTAALEAQRHGLQRLAVHSAAPSWRYSLPAVPGCEWHGHSGLLDLPTLIAMAAELAPGLRVPPPSR